MKIMPPDSALLAGVPWSLNQPKLESAYYTLSETSFLQITLYTIYNYNSFNERDQYSKNQTEMV